MPVTSSAVTDADGKVVWWGRIEPYQAEVHHVGPYRGRLRIWRDDDHIRPLFDLRVALPGDNRRPPSNAQTGDWLKHLRAAAAGTLSTQHTVGPRPETTAACEIECQFLDDVDVADRLLRDPSVPLLSGPESHRMQSVAESLRLQRHDQL
jgi:hypothetical protein